jgi:SRSO17 transposase
LQGISCNRVSSRWEADDLRDIVRSYALETLADDDAVLVIDETGFLKQGKASCGVARHYTGSAGKITNCQIGVFACYVSQHGHAFIDRALYLPKAWSDDPARMKAAHIPEETAFATKPALAVGMIERAIAAAAVIDGISDFMSNDEMVLDFNCALNVVANGSHEPLLSKAGVIVRLRRCL